MFFLQSCSNNMSRHIDSIYRKFPSHFFLKSFDVTPPTQKTPTHCILSVFGHFVGLALKGLNV